MHIIGHMTLYKICKHCGVHKSIDDFHLLKRGTFGRHPECKICRNLRYLNQNNSPPTNITEILCISCNTTKSNDNFYKCSKSRTGYQIYCKTCQFNKLKNNLSSPEHYFQFFYSKLKRQYPQKIAFSLDEVLNKAKNQNMKCSILNIPFTFIIGDHFEYNYDSNPTLFFLNKNLSLFHIQDLHIISYKAKNNIKSNKSLIINDDNSKSLFKDNLIDNHIIIHPNCIHSNGNNTSS
jgi:hypothetical protein